MNYDKKSKKYWIRLQSDSLKEYQNYMERESEREHIVTNPNLVFIWGDEKEINTKIQRES